MVRRSLMRYACALPAIGLAMIAGVSIAAYPGVPASEALMLPQFCWAQYMDNMKGKGPQYTIPVWGDHGCGVNINHYCPALVELQRARKAMGVKKKGERLQHLRVAKKDTLYTWNGIKDHPSCPIWQHVQTTLVEVNALLNAYGQGEE